MAPLLSTATLSVGFVAQNQDLMGLRIVFGWQDEAEGLEDKRWKERKSSYKRLKK